MKGRSDIETTTGADIARAAWMLVNECVRDQRGQGGAISGIILRTYDPVNVECVNEPQTYDSGKCEALLDEVPADTAPDKTWGPHRQAGVDIEIPFRWELGREFSPAPCCHRTL
ncbi:MAG: hypothetical protein LQ348_001054 [Seirophora lacunosa]|nr:MAG: hypothetical protein LQ348_001054 [Seirophora lacunosa]